MTARRVTTKRQTRDLALESSLSTRVSPLGIVAAVVCVPAAFACSPSETDGPGESREATEPTATEVPFGTAPAVLPADASLFSLVTAEAERRAGQAYRPPHPTLPETLSDLSYGRYRAIRFREDQTIWRGETPFELQLFHPGGASDVPVRIHLVEDGRVRTLGFEEARFTYDDEVAGAGDALPAETGHAGFRILYPLNAVGRADETVSFLGASYFRLLGPGHIYGLSSRGVAVDVAGPGGEEFPDFVEFWIERPDSGDASITFFGLLDGPSLAGAYRFVLAPGSAEGGAPTILEVHARLFGREDIGVLGVAPLTSMYLHGTFRRGGEDDFRPRVHDSEGLLMLTGDREWIWRPLSNRLQTQVTTLLDRTPRGFGLVQRTRDFDQYLDLEAMYHRRPSEWVAVDGGDWGQGGVQLVELPTPSEFNDNIVAYWAPDGGLAAGESRHFEYRLITFDGRLAGGELPGGALEGQSLAQVVTTRIGWDALPGQVDAPPRDRRRVVIDFAGGVLAEVPAGATVEADVSSSSGLIRDLRVEPLPGGGRRATFAIHLERDQPADMRVLLRLGEAGEPLSETWSYLLEPNR